MKLSVSGFTMKQYQISTLKLTTPRVLLLLGMLWLGPFWTYNSQADHNTLESKPVIQAVVLERWTSPFSGNSNRQVTNYQWQQQHAKQRRICAIIPKSATSYWFAMNYGLVKKARTLGAILRVYNIDDSGKNKATMHAESVQQCLQFAPQSIIVGGSLDQSIYQSLIQLENTTHLIAIGKNLASQGIFASSSPSYSDVGRQLSSYMNELHNLTPLSQSVLLPGEQSAQYVKAFVNTFTATLDPQKYQLNDTIFTTSYPQIKSHLTDYLNAHLDTTTIIGSALVAQAAVEVLDEMSLTGDIQIISYEFSAQVYRDIKRGNIRASITNLPVTQGFLAIDMALKNQSHSPLHVSPKTLLVDGDNINRFDISQIFAPYGYRETLEVN